jgi:hypothetical protein
VRETGRERFCEFSSFRAATVKEWSVDHLLPLPHGLAVAISVAAIRKPERQPMWP